MLAQSGWQGLLIEGEDILVLDELRSLSLLVTTPARTFKTILPNEADVVHFARCVRPHIGSILSLAS
jgi:hypothetical protein